MMKTSTYLPEFLRSESTIRILELTIAAIVITLVFRHLQFSTSAICCGDYDGYYHIKWTRLLWESLRSHSFPPQFVWLPLTSLDASHYVDHHLLFHFFQMPFVWFGDLRLGAKISAVIFASAALFSCYWLIVRYRIRYSLIWLIALLACSAPFLYRLSMAKAPPFAIIFLIISIYLLFSKRYWPLLPLAFVFTLTYDMFVLLILAATIWTAVIAWLEHRFEWRPLLWVLLGCGLGLIINPYFPRNIYLLMEHLRVKLTTSNFTTKVGGEWYPYDSWEFLGNSLVACVAMLVGYLAFEPSERERAHHPLFFLVFSTALMIMTARWKRIAEYWPPFAVIFAAFALQPWFLGARSNLTRLSTDILDELQPFLDRPPTANSDEEDWLMIRRVLVGVVAVAFLAVVLVFNVRATTKDIAGSDPHDHYRAGAEWMRANVPPQEMVFNTDWDDFPRLFYFDPTHRYVTGLDPTYLYDKDDKLSRLYDRITLGDEEDPGPLIRDRFGARYVFTDNSHNDFFDNAKESGWFEIVYEDSQCTILHIRDQKVEPPPDKTESTEEDSDDDNSNEP